MDTAGFNSVLQFNESFIAKCVEAALEHGVVPRRLHGEFRSDGQATGFELVLGYEFLLNSAQVRISDRSAGGLLISLAVNAALSLAIEGGPDDTGNPSEPISLFDCQLAAEVEGDIAVNSIQRNGTTFLVLEFNSLRRLNISLNNNSLPEKYVELFRRLAERALVVRLRHEFGQVPVSADFSATSIAGWKVSDVYLRVIGVPGRGNVCVALNTVPNSGDGDPHQIEHYIEGRDFGVAIDQNLLVQTLNIQWTRGNIPSRFDGDGKPDAAGSVRLTAFSVALEAGHLFISLHVLYETPGGNVSVWVHGKVAVKYSNGKFETSISEVSIGFPWVVPILGLLLFRSVYILLALAVTRLLGKAVTDLGGSLLEKLLNESDIELIYEGSIPGTNLTTRLLLVDMELFDSAILVTGDVSIQPEPTFNARARGD